MAQSLTEKQFKQLLQQEFVKMRLTEKLEKSFGEKLSVIKSEVSAVKKEHHRLKARVLETRVLQSSVEVANFPCEPELKPRDIITRIGRHVECPLTEPEIISATRMGKIKDVSGNKCQNLIVSFSSIAIADEFLECARTKKKITKQLMAHNACSRCPQGVEYGVYKGLPTEMKSLRWLAMKKKEALDFKYCWIAKSGKLLMKKIMTATSLCGFNRNGTWIICDTPSQSVGRLTVTSQCDQSEWDLDHL